MLVQDLCDPGPPHPSAGPLLHWTAPPPDRPKFRALFSFSHSHFHSFFSLWGSSRGILVVFRSVGTSNVLVFALGLSCETPAACRLSASIVLRGTCPTVPSTFLSPLFLVWIPEKKHARQHQQEFPTPFSGRLTMPPEWPPLEFPTMFAPSLFFNTRQEKSDIKLRKLHFSSSALES